jgi:predicted porin
MQKKLIALAIAGLASTGAFAQTNVTIYGVADIFYANVQSDQTAVGLKDAKFSGLATGGLSGNRLGFKAEEDLGGGWKAGMLFEFGTLGVDGGANGTSAAPVAAGAGGSSGLQNVRQSNVFVSSASMGTFQAGRIYTAGTNAGGKFDPEGASSFGPVSRITSGLALSIDGAGNNNARVNNSIAWLSPNWKGFSGQLQYSFGENGEQSALAATGNGGTDARMWGVGIDYTNGPLAVGFAYNDWNDYGGTIRGATGISRDMTEWFLGASYDFGMAKLFASYQDFSMDNMTTATAQGVAAANGTNGAKSDGDIWSVGATIPVMKAGTVTLSYASLDRTTRASKLAGVRNLGADADGWGISYKHALSKRTTAYVGYTQLDNGNKNNPLSTLGVGSGVATPGAGQDSSGYGMGMRHTF